jgi:hypothetical protein
MHSLAFVAESQNPRRPSAELGRPRPTPFEAVRNARDRFKRYLGVAQASLG